VCAQDIRGNGHRAEVGEGKKIDVCEAVMIKVVENILRDDGMKFVKVVSSLDVKIPLGKFVPGYLVKYVPHYIHAAQAVNDELGIMTTVFEFPMLGPVDVVQGDGELKKFFVVHRRYGRSVSDCVRIGMDGWLHGTGYHAQFGYVRSLPSGVECGREAFGVMVFEAEWMLSDCVAVR